ncbi:hypothetical protein D210916BOD24_07480 [Alteromonas sp. D210916BOD_24]|uniref:DsrE family protein n=1 Tax=Alteromonas sp. D210916BOD_24 TaxID=3157618 RepID=UPI00399D06E5
MKHLIFCLITLTAYSALANENPAFHYGPVFDKFGKHVSVDGVNFTGSEVFHIAFDATNAAQPGHTNRKFDSLARFINMHVANGVKKENVSLALVVHGSATIDLLNNKAYEAKNGVSNHNQELLKALMQEGVKVIVCGQSAAAHGIDHDMLIDGVIMELSAMTAYAKLAQQGYTNNPF